MCEARVAAAAIGQHDNPTTPQRCVAAPGNNLSTNILRRYAAAIWIGNYNPRVTAATRASPEAIVRTPLTRCLNALILN